MTGIVIKSTGTCTDRTLPMRNGPWTPANLGTALNLHLDGQLGKVVDGTNELVTWQDQKQGLIYSQTAGDGAMNAYSFNGITVPRLTLDGYGPGSSVVDATSQWRGFWIVMDVIDATNTLQNLLLDIGGLGVYRNASGMWQIGGVAAGSFVPGAMAAGKQIAVCYPSAAGTYKFRVNGTQLGSDFSTGTTQKVMGALRIGRWDPGMIDTAIAGVGITAGVLPANQVEKLEGYLADRWGMLGSLPTGHPYKTVLPRQYN